MTVLLFRTQRNGTERNENGTIEKKEQERNDLAEGPRSKTKRNDLKKVGTCPALSQTRFLVIQTQNNIWCRSGEWYVELVFSQLRTILFCLVLSDIVLLHISVIIRLVGGIQMLSYLITLIHVRDELLKKKIEMGRRSTKTKTVNFVYFFSS